MTSAGFDAPRTGTTSAYGSQIGHTRVNECWCGSVIERNGAYRNLHPRNEPPWGICAEAAGSGEGPVEGGVVGNDSKT